MMKKRMIKSLFVLLAVLVVLASLAGCRNTPGPPVTDAEPPPEIVPILTVDELPRIDGSTANIPMASLMIQRLTGISEIEADKLINFTKTDGAYYALENEWADLLLVYEGDRGIDIPGMEFYPIGRDGLVFLTNKSNPVPGLTTDQIRGIYTGAITNWSEVGGNNMAITAFQRQEASGSGTLMKKLVMGDAAMMEAPSELIPAEMGELITALAQYDNSGGAIGYSVYYYASKMYNNESLKMLAVDGTAPSNATIANGSYPFINEFYAVIRADEPEGSRTRQVLEWLLSPEGTRCISDAGYVPVTRD